MLSLYANPVSSGVDFDKFDAAKAETEGALARRRDQLRRGAEHAEQHRRRA